MVGISRTVAAATTLLAGAVSAKSISLTFDELNISNEQSCGKVELSNTVGYHGVFPSSAFFANVEVYNTTATPACHRNAHDEVGVFDQKRATSGSNVAYGRIGSVDFQVSDANAFLTGDASLDVSVVFTKAELANKDNLVTFDTLISDFGALDVRKTFSFHTAKDGFGPYHIHAPNTAKYEFFEVEAGVGVAGESSFRHPTIFVDNVQLETVAN
ncbi:hypothetical protein VHEMI04346 [[Torrubiella] hemipterigena]|uniref:Glycoside hydrolase 131 catalytic N-terminal domain-containing protein n=1 Tax=[Torrubiella] hemipterigena TaxID=1531966 RepID=A0A0A1SV08_9HYPO|nr:hypothetical protein VHEMI04346 [[Torrubiella] hemipterigena]